MYFSWLSGDTRRSQIDMKPDCHRIPGPEQAQEQHRRLDTEVAHPKLGFPGKFHSTALLPATPDTHGMFQCYTFHSNISQRVDCLPARSTSIPIFRPKLPEPKKYFRVELRLQGFP